MYDWAYIRRRVLVGHIWCLVPNESERRGRQPRMLRDKQYAINKLTSVFDIPSARSFWESSNELMGSCVRRARRRKSNPPSQARGSRQTVRRRRRWRACRRRSRLRAEDRGKAKSVGEPVNCFWRSTSWRGDRPERGGAGREPRSQSLGNTRAQARFGRTGPGRPRRAPRRGRWPSRTQALPGQRVGREGGVADRQASTKYRLGRPLRERRTAANKVERLGRHPQRPGQGTVEFPV